jgi:hypothetical protein
VWDCASGAIDRWRFIGLVFSSPASCCLLALLTNLGRLRLMSPFVDLVSQRCWAGDLSAFPGVVVDAGVESGGGTKHGSD